MRARTLGVSFAVHGIVGLVLASLATHEAPAPTPTTTIELVDAPSPSPPVIETRVAAASSSGSRTRVRANRPRLRTPIEDPRGEIRVETGDVTDAEEIGGDGTGEGIGLGRGGGIGLGDGARITEATVAVVTPPPPAASKARIAKLVYPVREREVDDSELFVARVTIDDEGYVVGAKLVKGFGGPRDAQAADLIWKFRYAPALDDEGRAIRSTFDQKFLVGR